MRPDEYKQAASRRHAQKQKQKDGPTEKKAPRKGPVVAPQPERATPEAAEPTASPAETKMMTEEEKIKQLQAEEERWIKKTVLQIEENEQRIDIAQRQLASVPPSIEAHPYTHQSAEEKTWRALAAPIWHRLYDPPDHSVSSGLCSRNDLSALQATHLRLDYAYLQSQLEKETPSYPDTATWEAAISPQQLVAYMDRKAPLDTRAQ